MAELGDDMDDNKMDLEAHNQRQEQTKEIEALGFDQEQYEAIESEFKEFLNDHLKGKDLEKFRQEYQKINKALRSSYEGEKKLIKKCKELISQIFEKASNYRAALRMANNEVDKIAQLKQDVSKNYEEVQNIREQEESKREEIGKLRIEINNLKRQKEQTSELEEDVILRSLMGEFDELYKTKEEQDERLEAMKTKNKESSDEMKQCEDDILNQIDEITKVEGMIKNTKEKKQEKEAQKKEYEQETIELREEIEKQKVILEEEKNKLREVRQENKVQRQYILEQEDANERLKQKNRELESEKAKCIKELDEEEVKKKNSEDILKEKIIKRDQLEQEAQIVAKKCRQKERQVKLYKKKEEETHLEININIAQRESMKSDLELITTTYETKKENVENDKKDIEQKTRERDLLNKDVATAEEKEREQVSTITTLENELKKLQNKIQGYKAEAQKLQKLIHQLEKDKQKYGIEASQANAKYYQCLEQVKIKNNLIVRLQKKNIEAEGRLKQQQNLYEAVRSDRNLYSKNLLEAQEEIAELKMKFRRMTQQISQLKEEIYQKDQQIVSEEEKQKNYNTKNAHLLADIQKIEKNIESSEDMIKTQESDIARLKYVISEAESEKQKQKKDYEMVINERDILGTQLIKRHEELALLYEKIKIQKSTLDKGEIYYQEKQNDIREIRKQIADLKRQLIVSQNETMCIPDLKREIYLLQKEYLEQQQKAKYLHDELEKPFNVHRWRKLECTQPETYEMIQKIQSLQKRLIAKTEEVSEKDVLIQEKEKLYIELKNIIAKQSGPEVAEKLQVYQQNLKERTNQLKEMVKELKNYQSQVNAYKFEIERLDKQINSVKELYFNSKQNVIYEEMEGDNQQIDQNQGLNYDINQQQQPMMQGGPPGIMMDQNQMQMQQQMPPDGAM